MSEAAPPRVIATFNDLPSLIAAFRLRQAELQISHENLSELCGFPVRFTSKILAPMRGDRNLHGRHIGALAGGLMVRFLMVEDEESRRRFGHRVMSVKKKSSCLLSKPVQVVLSRRFLQKIGRAGGKRSRANMSRAQARRLARKGAAARAEALSSEQRSEIARKAARSRWASHRMHGDRQATAV